MFPPDPGCSSAAPCWRAVGAVVYGVTHGGSLGTDGLITPRRRSPSSPAINLVHPRRRRLGDGPGGAHRVRPPPPAPWPSLWPIVGAARRVLVSSGWSPTRSSSCSASSPSSPPRRVDGAGVERAGLGRRRVQRRGPRAHRPPAEFPVLGAVGAGIIIYSFSRIMLFLSKASGPAASPRSPRSSWSPASSSPSGATSTTAASAGCAAVAVLALVAGGVAAALEVSARLHPHETTGPRRRRECGDRRRPRPTSTPRRPSPQGQHLRRDHLADDGTLVAHNLGVTGDRRRSSFQRPTRRTSCSSTRATRSAGSCSTSAPAPESTRTGDTSSRACPTSVHALVEEGGSQLLTFSIDRRPAPAETRTASSCPGSTARRRGRGDVRSRTRP